MINDRQKKIYVHSVDESTVTFANVASETCAIKQNYPLTDVQFGRGRQTRQQTRLHWDT